ncbi:MAG: hypothetical protein NTU73_04610 [Ignavibacteriae bacterium]|nr:hypothetical protein [Ignavibacteriota bacterium]
MKKLLLLVILFSFVILQSCGNKDEKTDVKKDEKTEQPKSDEKNTTTGDVKTEEKKDGDITGLGLTSGLPQDFPKDIPQPNNSKGNGFLGSTDGTVVTFESKDNLKSILEFYKTNMEKNGYKSQEGNEYFQNENGAMLGYKKGEKEVGFLFGISKENNVTQVVITYK